MMRVLILICLSCSVLADLKVNNEYQDAVLGETGIVYNVKKNFKVYITGTLSESPVSGKLLKGDQIIKINGRSLSKRDPRISLGSGLNTTTGKMLITVLRGSKETDITVPLPKSSKFSKTWPLKCKKSDRYIKDAAEFIIKEFKTGRYRSLSMDVCWAGLFLLSTGDENYMPVVKRMIDLQKGKGVSGHAWSLGYQGLFLTEYYLRTKDKEVLPLIAEFADKAAKGNAHGGWSHSVSGFGSGYVQGALVLAAGLPVFMGVILAEECGVTVDPKEFKRMLALHFRIAGYGAVPYGDHRPIYFIGDNGKCGMLACSLQLLDHKKFQKAAHVLAMQEAGSYANFEGGHGTMFFNVMWRSIGAVHVPKSLNSHYHNHMNKLAWYYDICRRPDGSFHPYKVDRQWLGGINFRFGTKGSNITYSAQKAMGTTAAMGLAFTAPLKHLRIMGKVNKQRKKIEAAQEFIAKDKKSEDFLNPHYSKGGSSMGKEPEEIIEILKHKFSPRGAPLSLEFCKNMIRHCNPVIRFYAAGNLGYIGDSALPAIIEALESKDDRVRRAGLDAFNGRMYWGRGPRCNISQKNIQDKLMPYAIKILRDRDEDYWNYIDSSRKYNIVGIFELIYSCYSYILYL